MSLLNLRAITESFDKKYSLNEHTPSILTEAFSPTFPQWLKNALKISGMWEKWDKKYPDYSDRITQEAKDEKQEIMDLAKQLGIIDTRRITLLPRFIDRGVNLDNVVFTELPVGKGIPKRTKNQQWIPICYFDDGSVWARGINDWDSPEWTGRCFDEISNTELRPHIEAIGYIMEKDAFTDYTARDKRLTRAGLKQELEEINKQYAPLEQRYADALQKIKDAKMSKIVEGVKEEVDQFINRAQSIINTKLDLSNTDDRRLITRTLDIIDNILLNYGYLTGQLEVFVDAFNRNDRYDMNIYRRNINNYISSIHSNINDSTISGYFKATADWLF